MKKLPLILVTAALLLCLGVLWMCLRPGAGPAAEDAVPMKIAVWTNNEEQLGLLGGFVGEFAEKKGIEIDCRFESIDFSEYNTKLFLELQGTDAPDVFWVLENSAKAFIASGNLAVLNGALAGYDPSDFLESALGLWKEGDDIYAVPFSTSPFILIYNADLLEQAGAKTPEEYMAEGDWTWDSFREICRKVKDNTGVWGYQTVDGQGYKDKVVQNLIPIIRSYGADAWDSDGNVLIDSEEAVEAVRLYHDMVYKDRSVVPPGDESSFYTGAAAMTVGQISRLSNLADVSWRWSVCRLPGNSPVIGQAAIAANAKSGNRELAEELVAYMTNKECVTRIAGIWPPARASVLESEQFLTSGSYTTPEQMRDAVAASIAEGRVLPTHILYPQIQVETQMIYDKLWNADADVAAVLHEVGDVYRRYLG